MSSDPEVQMSDAASCALLMTLTPEGVIPLFLNFLSADGVAMRVGAFYFIHEDPCRTEVSASVY